MASVMLAGTGLGHVRRSRTSLAPKTIENRIRRFSAPPVNGTDRVTRALAVQPLSFEQNSGQANPTFQFLGRGKAYTVLIGANEPSLEVRANSPSGPDLKKTHGSLRIRMLGGSRDVRPEGVELLPHKTNYMIGNDPGAWRVGVENFAKVVYRNLYPGVSMFVYGRGDRVEYDFVLSPGSNPRAIRFRVDGAERLRIDSASDLVAKTASGEFRQHRPGVYQEVGGRRRTVPARYKLRGSEVGITVGRYDRSRPLIIDPILSYSGYLGGSGRDGATVISVDSQGNAFVAGSTDSINFPGAPVSPGFDGNAFLAKLDPTGSLLFSTVFGGNRDDAASGIAVDAAGSVYVAGRTLSRDFPTSTPAQPECMVDSQNLCSDLFVSKFNATGSGFVYSTYLGGRGQEFAFRLAVDSAGAAYVVGSTPASDFPAVNALQPVHRGPATTDGDCFITKLEPSGAAFAYSTLLGGSGFDRAMGLAVDSSGNAYITGFTRSGDYPLANPVEHVPRHAAYKTTSNGASWEPEPGLKASDVTALEVDPNSPSTIYAGTEGSGLLKTTDGGGSWRRVAEALIGVGRVFAITVDPSSSAVVYAAAVGAGVVKSTDAGETWGHTGVVLDDGSNPRPLLNVRAVAVDPEQPSNVYATTSSSDPNTVVKSTNAGVTWKRVNPVNTAANCLAIHPRRPSIVLAGAQKSTDGGGTWTRTFTSGFALAVIFDPVDPKNAYIGASGGVFKSTDTGSTWVRLPSPVLGQVQALAIDPENPAVLYAGGNFAGGIIRSTDAGASWTVVNTGITTGRINALVVAPMPLQVVFAGVSIPMDAFVTKLNASGSALIYSTTFGGSLDDFGQSVAVDPSGNALVTGNTVSSDFPVINPIQPGLGGSADAFVAKFDPDGRGVYSTYLGGSEVDQGMDIASDKSGNAYIAGLTRSADFPVVEPVQPFGGPGATDGFVAKLNAAGARLSYSTWLGGSDDDLALAIAVDSIGSAVVAGETRSGNFPLAGTGSGSLAGVTDGFVAKLVHSEPATPGLALFVKPSASQIQSGSNITYSITLTNIGPSSTQSVVLTDDLPAGLNFVSCSSSLGGICGGSGNTRTISFSSLGPGASAIVNITAASECSLASGSLIDNRLTVSTFDAGPVAANVVTTVTNQPPLVSCPSAILVQTLSGAAIPVNYPQPEASDNCPGVEAVCSPASGTTFPVGATTVSCLATDAGGATASCAFTVTVTASNIPAIEGASISGKKLIVTGRGFDRGARILVDGVEAKTKNDGSSPATALIAKKAGKTIAPGQTVSLQVRNPDGITSGVFLFRRPG
jgi:uncharacterized repeat protein (TIGR01451 family)